MVASQVRDREKEDDIEGEGQSEGGGDEAGDEARDEAGDEAGECRTGETLLDLAKDSAKIAISEISGFFM